MKINLISNIFLGVMGAVALCLVLLALIPKSYNIGINNEPYKISIYQGSSTAKYECSADASESQKKNYNEIIDLYNSMFTTSSLNALFSKIISYSPDYDYDTTTFYNLVTKSGYVLKFDYSEKQTLYKGGEPYTNSALTDSNYENKIATFNTLWIAINEFEGFNTITFYLQSLATSSRAIIKVETLGQTHNLYEFLSNMDFNS